MMNCFYRTIIEIISWKIIYVAYGITTAKNRHQPVFDVANQMGVGTHGIHEISISAFVLYLGRIKK